MSDDLYESFFWINLDQEDEDEDDEIYKPDDQTDDDEEAVPLTDLIDGSKNAIQNNAKQTIARFNSSWPLPQSQFFVGCIPELKDISQSPFTVGQWDVLRHQCRLHHSLLCRSIRFSSFSASSDPVLSSLITLLHSFHLLYKNACETTTELNNLIGRDLFTPCFGDVQDSNIQASKLIIDHFLQGKHVDDLIDIGFFTDILKSLPSNIPDRPHLSVHHFPWFPEEDELLRVSMRRFQTPEDIQRYVIPGRTLKTISEHMKEEWIQPHVAEYKTDDAERTSSTSSDDDEQTFVVQENMEFEEVELKLEEN